MEVVAAVAFVRRVPISGTFSLRVVRVRRAWRRRRPFHPTLPRRIRSAGSPLARTTGWTEALGLLPMLDPSRPGHVTREQARALIAPASLNGDVEHDHAQHHRTETLLAFDSILWQQAIVDHRNGGVRAALEAGYLTRELEAEIVRLFRTGAGHAEIRARIPVGHVLIETISKRHRASEWKSYRGRRIPAETRSRIVAAIRQMQRPGPHDITTKWIAWKFFVSPDYVADLRRELGDREDRRLRRKLDAHQVRQANRMLREGATWRSVAQAFHVALWTLQRVCQRTGRHSGRQPKRRTAAA